MYSQALTYLQQMLGPDASFRDGQWEAIESVVDKTQRLLVVQRTGWGKSLVYFLATRLLRDRDKGPSLLISPLLALMRNQILMAQKIGVRAATINSANTSEWQEVEARLARDEVDILLISPERLNSERFLEKVLQIPFVPILAKSKETRPQKEMANSAQQVANIISAFSISGTTPAGPGLLVDDIFDSRWTLTVAGFLLAQHGFGPVYPFALAKAADRRTLD